MDAPWTPIFLAVMFMLHPYLGWLSVFGAIVLFALALANEVTTRSLLLQSGGASMAALSQAETAARNADVIEAMGMMPGMIKRWREKNLESLDLQARASSRSGSITAASKLLRMFLQIGILSIGAWLVIQGELTAGAMIAGSILMGRALAPVEQAIGTWKQMVGARNAYDRIKDQLDQTPSGPPGMPLPAPTGVVHADGAAFTYPGAKEPILRNITFGLEPGEALGLIGPTAHSTFNFCYSSCKKSCFYGTLKPLSAPIIVYAGAGALWFILQQFPLTKVCRFFRAMRTLIPKKQTKLFGSKGAIEVREWGF
jgi:ATP-binding cassette subfamily B protein/ATP-binding cassette subfamily C protein